MDLTYLHGDIVKTEKTDDGLIVFGKATGPDLDIDKQICDPGWLEKAMPAWMEWGNLREGHSNLAAGVGLELLQDGANWNLKSLCVDPTTQRKLEAKVLKGYSIGIKGARIVKDSQAPGGRIVDGEIVEISYVDRPANPTAKITIAKSADTGGDLQPTDENGDVLAADVIKNVAAEVVKAAASAKEINDLPDSDFAYIEPGGEKDDDGKTTPRSKRHFPIHDEAHVRNALSRAPQSPFGDKALPKIRAAAKKYGIEVSKAVDVLEQVWGLGLDLTKDAGEDETTDISGAQQAIAIIARLIQSEAGEMAAGENESGDIRCLLEAVCALQYFIACEQAEQQGDDDMDLTVFGVSADVVKAAQADDATDEAKAAPLAELKKALGLDDEHLIITKAALADTVKTALEEPISGLEERLATVEQMAAPGGAIRTRTQAEAGKAAERDRLESDRDRYLNLANEIHDKDLAQGYRAKAVEVGRQLAAL